MMKDASTNEPGPLLASRIAVVDDDASIRRALQRLCRSAGYQVETFDSAEAFLECAGAQDCLILDVNLPGLSGLELQSKLRSENQQIPVIIVTAFEDQQTMRKALNAGAVEFLRKPLDSEQLLDVIKKAIEDCFRE